MTAMRPYLLRLAAILAAGLIAGSDDAAAQFYKDKTLTLLVNYGAGGNADTAARMFQRHISRHIPGRPNVVVQNMPGAGGYTAMNNLGLNINRRPDGLTAGYFGLSPPGLIAKDPGLRVTMQDFAMIGAARDWGVAYVRRDAGVEQPADLARVKQIFAGGYARSNSNDARSSLALQVFEVPYRMVTGFSGTADLNKAMMQNEINYITSALPAFQRLAIPQLIKTGIAIPVFYYPVAKPDGEPGEIPALERLGVSSFHKVYQQAYGKPPAGPKFDALLLLCDLGSNTHGVIALPKDAPPEAIADLRQGFNALRSDAEFIKEYQALSGEPPSLVIAEDLAPILKRLETVSPDVIRIVKETTGL